MGNVNGQGDARGDYYTIEAIFEQRNFMHLTGCKPASPMPAEAFLELCLSKRLSIDDFTVTSQTALKMQVLESLMRLPYTAKMLGDYADTGDFLYTEKLAGHIRGCIGFQLGDKAPYYSPNTALRTDIRNNTTFSRKILAIYAKQIGALHYDSSPVMVAKELRSKELIWPDVISEKIQ